MQTLEQLYNQYYKPSQQLPFQNIIEENHQALIANLAKEDRILVLRIIDAKDHIAGLHELESFTCGFNLAMELRTELENYKKGYSLSENEMG